ncbi:MAG: hypothetical protein M1837_003491 [Sclerophora amabilis]|nr:MAG: hypothetical protein M1837_003491 [Sclerophora amabilis]
METNTIPYEGMKGLGLSESRPSQTSLSRMRKTYPNNNQNGLVSPDDVPPPPPPKDSPRTPLSPTNNQGVVNAASMMDCSDEAQSYFNPFGLQRTDSIYSLSRVSLGSQISQLTSLQLPQASTISSNISSIPTSTAATKVLSGSADQIRKWIRKASGLLKSMNADDDVEWAAAGGREGLSDIDGALNRFEDLIGVYVAAIEKLQMREDISSVPRNELEALVAQMEQTLQEWNDIRSLLKNVKEQVEMAMEWEELWNNVLGDIGEEVDELNRLVFEMEERRHRALMSEANGDGLGLLDLGELETIVEDSPLSGSKAHANNRMSLPPAFPVSSPVASPSLPIAQDDSSLLALFARMQPLRASLDFLPMRLSSFNHRAQSIFPTACDELDARRKSLEHDWKMLQGDAESLRHELGEDRWVIVFKNAARQAQKMCESVKRSLVKLEEGLELGSQHGNPPSLARKIESFEAKKMHYGPAIQRVLGIIEKGLGDRLTVNGEVLRLRSEMEKQWRTLEAEIKDMDMVLEEINSIQNQQLRDSISSSISLDRSASGSGFATPGSSPASSVVMSGPEATTPHGNGKPRPAVARNSSLPRPPNGKRGFSMPGSATPTNGTGPRRTPISRLSTVSRSTNRSVSPSIADRRISSTPTSLHHSRPTSSASDNKPRWNASTNTRDTVIGHNFKSLSTCAPSSTSRQTPSPQRRTPHPSRSSIPLPSPLGRGASPSPVPPSATQSYNTPSHLGRRPASSLAGNFVNDRRRSVQFQGTPSKTTQESTDSTPSARPKPTRPASAMASGRRISNIPQTRTSAMRLANGRQSVAGSSSTDAHSSRQSHVEVGKERPKWR